MSCLGLRGEDTGILACQQLNNNDFIAYVDVIVYGKALCCLFHAVHHIIVTR